MTYPTSPEFALTIACCRWPRSAERNDAVRDAASRVTDWNLFDRLVARHRVTPLARDGLACAGVTLPNPVEERLGARAAQCAVTALAMARETVRLQRAFQTAGLPAFIIKGIAVGILAYGDPCMKESWDIDLLTSIEALPDAHSLLESLGYELNLSNPVTPEQFRRFAKFANEAAYLHRESGLTVELHWRLSRNRSLLPAASAHSSSQVVRAAGAELLTFDDDILFAYLCIHGTQHGWRRLKWLADLNAFIASRSPDRIQGMYRVALDAGAGRAPAVSLLLCRRLLGTPLPPSLGDLDRDRSVRRLEAVALHYIEAPLQGVRPIPMQPKRLQLSLLSLTSGSAYLAEEFRSTWNVPLEQARFGFAAHFLRIPLWLARGAKRLRGHLAGQAVEAIGD